MFVACRDAIITWAGFKDLYLGLEALGLRSFELQVGRRVREGPELPTSLGIDVSRREDRLRLMEELKSRGLSINALLIENDFSREDIQGEVGYVVKACEVAADLGVKVVRINALMKETAGLGLKDYHEKAVKCIRECLKVSERLGVSLAVENHGTIANRHGFLYRLLDEVNSDFLGLTLDTGNFYWYGYPLDEVYDIYHGLATYVKHTHIKNAKAKEGQRDRRRKPGQVSMAPLYEGDIDLKTAIDILRYAGYTHDLTIEDESLGQFNLEERREVLLKDVKYMKSLV